MNLRNWFDSSLRLRAAEPALEWLGATYTFGDIDARSNRMAHALTARGFQRGDRLAVYLANSLDFIDLFLACTRIGALFVPIAQGYRGNIYLHMRLASKDRRAVVAMIPAARQMLRAVDPDLLAACRRHPDRTRSTLVAPAAEIYVDRARARFGSWYELFPRSWGGLRGRKRITITTMRPMAIAVPMASVRAGACARSVLASIWKSDMHCFYRDSPAERTNGER